MGDIINTDKIEKITYDKMLNNKWILTAVFSGSYSQIGTFDNLCELVQYKQRLEDLIGVINLDEDEYEEEQA
jgi:hypothetical protein